MSFAASARCRTDSCGAASEITLYKKPRTECAGFCYAAAYHVQPQLAEPVPITEAEIQQRKEEEQRRRTERLKASFMKRALAINAKLPKKKRASSQDSPMPFVAKRKSPSGSAKDMNRNDSFLSPGELFPHKEFAKEKVGQQVKISLNPYEQNISPKMEIVKWRYRQCTQITRCPLLQMKGSIANMVNAKP